MINLPLASNPAVAKKFATYPDSVRPKMEKLRRWILEVAEELEEVKQLEETLKWGEPSYLNPAGSTLRMDWKAKRPNQYALYFKCTSRLVPTFKTVFGDLFGYEKNRAILFEVDGEVPPEKPVKTCMAAALRYHKVKQLEALGLRP